jgi:hypothetical protein
MGLRGDILVDIGRIVNYVLSDISARFSCTPAIILAYYVVVVT